MRGFASQPIFHGWVVAWVMFASLALVFGSRFSMGLFLPFLPDALAATPSQVSGAIALSMLGAGLMQPLVGHLCDRVGPRRMLLVGLVCGGGLFVATAFVTAVWQMAAVMFLMGGVAFAAVSPVLATAFMARWFDRHRGRALGVATSGTKVALLTLVPAISIGIALMGWRPTMVAMGLLIWMMLPVAWVLVRSKPEEMGLRPDGEPETEGDTARAAARDAASWSLQSALRSRSFWMVALALFGNGFVMNLVFLHLPSYILSQGHGPTLAAAGLSILGAVGLVGHLFIGTLSDRASRKGVLMLLFAARIAALLFVVAVPGMVSLVTFVVVFGVLGYGALAVVGAMVADLFGPRALGAILGVAYVLNQLGGSAGIYAGGLSLDLTGAYEAAFLLAAGVSAVSLAAVATLPSASSAAKPSRRHAVASERRHSS
jgi:MFS family permease